MNLPNQSTPLSIIAVSQIVLAVLLLSPGISQAERIHIGPRSSIQQTIDSAANGDVIILAPGTYLEHTISTRGKAITIQGTIDPQTGELLSMIDGQQGGPVFVIDSGESSSTALQLLHIMNGYATNGGGIFCAYASPVISGCEIYSCHAESHGGGVFINGEATIAGCIIQGNSALLRGGGLHLENNSQTIVNTFIRHNTSDGYGGGVHMNDSSVTFNSCSISNNNATDLRWPHPLPWYECEGPPGGCNCVAGYHGYGGNFFVHNSNLELNDSTISFGEARYSTGGILFDLLEFPGKLVLNNCVVEDNHAYWHPTDEGPNPAGFQGDGNWCAGPGGPGGILIREPWDNAAHDLTPSDAEVHITDTIFANNTSFGPGSAIETQVPRNLHLTNCTFENNSNTREPNSNFGSIVHLAYNSINDDLYDGPNEFINTVNNCVFRENTADSVIDAEAGSIHIYDSEITNNTGRGIHRYNPGALSPIPPHSLVIVNSLIADNNSSMAPTYLDESCGGGVYWDDRQLGGDSYCYISGSTIARNSANRAGGLYLGAKYITIHDSTITDNMAVVDPNAVSETGYGGGIYLAWSTNYYVGEPGQGYLISNCIFQGNMAESKGHSILSKVVPQPQPRHVVLPTIVDSEFRSGLNIAGVVILGDNDVTTGACCTDWIVPCITTTKRTCEAQGNIYLGDGVPCTDFGCNPDTGACCFTDGCSFQTLEFCDDNGGTWLGLGVPCSECDEPGICCLPTGCDDITETQCISLTGTWIENGQCQDCPATCIADLDGNAIVDIDDVLLLLTLYGTTCP